MFKIKVTTKSDGGYLFIRSFTLKDGTALPVLRSSYAGSFTEGGVSYRRYEVITKSHRGFLYLNDATGEWYAR